MLIQTKMEQKLKFISNMKKLLIPVLTFALLTSCSQGITLIESNLFYFDTAVNIKLYEGDKDDVQEIEKIIKYYDQVSDNYNERSGVTISSITKDNIAVDEKLYTLLKTSVDVQKEGATYFNPLCGSLAKKWKESLAKKEVVEKRTIESELNKINNTTLTFTSDYQVAKEGEAEIDLGGIVKGYALDDVSAYLNEKGYKKYLINAGNSSILLGNKDTNDGLFTVKINDLDNSYLKLKDCFISTSSVSVQGVDIEDQLTKEVTTYSHIINPVTGSAINENDAVIVISDKGYLGDALSTSMMMNSIEEIKEIELTRNVKTIVIKDRKVTYSHKDITIYNG